MHGRLKVKTTAQQEAEKKAERRQKVARFKAAMNEIFDVEARVREQLAGEKKLEELEPEFRQLLDMSSPVLQGNPDIAFLWGVRRLALNSLLRIHSCEEPDEVGERLLRSDVEVTQHCLMTNPKSYGAWQHRCWCFLKMHNNRKKSDAWEKEVALCNKFLSHDERNFHCWDHRRFAVKEAGIRAEQELEYTMELINKNFSNYSAWHYRSKLLPLCFPLVDGPSNCISEEKRAEEIELVQNAAFTDPEDSSAWFYHTWLVGMGKSDDNGPDRVLAVKFVPGAAPAVLVVVSTPVPSSDLVITVNDIPAKAKSFKQIPRQPGTDRSCLWEAVLDGEPRSGDSIQVTLMVRALPLLVKVLEGEGPLEAAASGDIDADHENDLNCDDTNPNPIETSLENLPTKAVLEKDLQNCRDLLELEPDSKWTRLSMTLILKALDQKANTKEIEENIRKLREGDPIRKNFYDDWLSRESASKAMKAIVPQGSCDSLKDLGLTYVPKPERLALVTSLDLSGNNLWSTEVFLPCLRNCSSLNLDGNKLETVSGLEQLSRLKELSLRGNPICQNATSVAALEKTFPHISFTFTAKV